jgi:2-dehydro-3-deoxyphosphogluconate aldolase / (4S)-4-hydroxy-2-oxoglutarate aldolase
MEVLERLEQLRLVPIIVINRAAAAVPLADALLAGGLPIAEVTFRTAAAADALRRMAVERPHLLLGAGTVLSPAQAAEAVSAGARFIVAPGFNAAVVDYCLERDLPVFPGVSTPTEIEMALERGLTTLKLFPAEALGGLGYLKAITGPYGMVRFIPTGGVNAGNLRAYLDYRQVVACGGSWMTPAEWIDAGDFERIRRETARAVALASGESKEA